MEKVIEHNEKLHTPFYLPSHLESVKKHDYVDVPDLETKIQHDNPHY